MIVTPTRYELDSRASAFLERDFVPNYVGGRETRGSGKLFDVVDPATGETVAQASGFTREDVDNAVLTAHKAQPSWASKTPDERAVCLHRLADLIEQHLEPLAQLESLDVGKAVVNARSGDIPFGNESFRYFADLAKQAVYDTPLAIKNMEARVHRAPYGVCGFIFPWNFPFLLLSWGVAPALAAGNSVVVKAASLTPLTSLYFATLVEEAGIPAGVVNVFTGSGAECGQPIAENPLVKRVSLTGSTSIGKQIGRICGESLKPCKLELGGKGAAVVLPDADLEKAAQGLAGAITLNSGQVCCTATRWFVHEQVKDELADRLKAILTSTKVGPGLDESTQMGPVVSKKQMDTVVSYYEKGLSQGAKPLVEMTRPQIGDGDGFFVTPHVIMGDDDSNICFQEEIFGPASYMTTFRDDSEVVERVNSVGYGLANSVWTADLQRASAIAEGMAAGNSWINAHNVFAYGLPYGGVNLSGVGGGVNGPDTFQDYLQPKTIARPL